MHRLVSVCYIVAVVVMQHQPAVKPLHLSAATHQLQAAAEHAVDCSRAFSERCIANFTGAMAAVTLLQAVAAKLLLQAVAAKLQLQPAVQLLHQHQHAAKLLLLQAAVAKSLQIHAASQHVIITWPACSASSKVRCVAEVQLRAVVAK